MPVIAKSSADIISFLKWIKVPIGSFKTLTGIDAIWGIIINKSVPSNSILGVSPFISSLLNFLAIPSGTTILVAIFSINSFCISRING